MANEEQSDTTVIRHGLQYGELPEAAKSALLSRGLGDPLTRVLRRYTPNDGIGAYPCLVLDSTTGEIEGSVWALRGSLNWEVGYKARHLWGKEAKNYSLTLNVPNEEIEFPGDTQLKCYSKWQDAFLKGWAQITDKKGEVLQDIDALEGIKK